MSVVYVLTTPMPKDRGDTPIVEQVRKRAKWDNDDYVCRGLILNGMSDSLFDIYQNVETSKELWDTLVAKYMAEDASSKKFLVSNFTNYKMTNSRPVLEQYNELLGILSRFTQHKINMDESIQVSCIIDKLPPLWKDFKHTLKHLKEELTLVELGSHLRIEESLRAYNDNKGKRKHHDTKADPNKKPKVTCWKYRKPGHLKKDWKAGNVGNKANGSGTKGSVDGSSNSLKDIGSRPLNDRSILHIGNESTVLVHGRGCVDLRLNIVSDNIGSAFMSTSKLNDLIIWHARLGHAHFKRMQDMSKDGLIPTFDMDTEKLIYDEALDKFKVFKTGVKLQQGSLIKRFRTDRGGEYMDTLYFQSVGIIYETTAPYTPQQNGISERKNRGFKQKSGIDYFDTYAPVARISTIRLLIAMTSIHSLIIHQMDMKTTFLNSELDKKVYMNQPRGFIMPDNENKVLFYERDHGEDDLILGIRIKHESNGIAISQSHYIEKVLKKFNYFDCTPVSTPMDTSEKLMPNNGQDVSQLEYSRVIGCLMYAMTCTRPDIAFDVGKLSRYTSNPGTQHWQAIQRVLKYLKKTMDYRLMYTSYPSVLEGYTDASWISNTEDDSSTSGWAFLLGGGAISWASKKQTCITGSIMKYEFVALKAAMSAEGLGLVLYFGDVCYRDTQLPAEETWQLSSMWKAELISRSMTKEEPPMVQFIPGNGAGDTESTPRLSNSRLKDIHQSDGFSVIGSNSLLWKVITRFQVISGNHLWLNIVSDNIGSAFMSTSKLNDSILWHARLGHVHFKRMQDMSKDGLIPAFDMDTEKCQTCMLNKITKKPFQNVKHETEVLELIHSDLCDLHATPSLGNKKMIGKFDFATLKTASTPMEPNKALVKDEEADSMDVHLYRSMIGSLMYLTTSRLDITFVVCASARFQVTPKTSHLHVVKRIFRYLKGQPKLGLWYPRYSPFDLESFSDSDYAGASLDRKSTTGGCQFLGKRLISWCYGFKIKCLIMDSTS
ncbi:zinc finger, CCHC-type containing protein [Tanacetum coccineum]